MPVYKATVKFTGTRDIEFEAMGDAEASEMAYDIFNDMDKGQLGLDIEASDITVNRMGSEDIAERRAEARGDI